jgi:hypothetical protein
MGSRERMEDIIFHIGEETRIMDGEGGLHMG